MLLTLKAHSTVHKGNVMLEIQDIFKKYGTEYQENHKLPKNHFKAMRNIERCRTEALGGHVDKCNECGYIQISYNSCRDRHCPKCQTLSKERWIEARKEDLLPVQYFHVVFTIPENLNPIVFQNQKETYTILFRAVSETLSELAQDKKYLGAQLGFISILHTWGQNLMHHPHIHCIVPGGGLSACNKWVNSKKKFFLPIKVLSRKFRGKFLFYLKKAYYENAIHFYGSQEHLVNERDFESFLSLLYKKEWVAYCKAPFKSADHVVEYLGRYTHRVAISNNRILKEENGQVTFKWRDYRDSNKEKLMSVSTEEFIRRFLTHVLPSGFFKIRYYGILGSRNKKTKLMLCKKLTGATLSISSKKKLSAEELILKLTGRDITLCPCCGCGRLQRVQCLSPPVYERKTQ
jgi:predicted Zn-ribbon and HTH transcriptional regulator